MASIYRPVTQRKARGAPKTDRQTSHRLAGMADAEIIAAIAAYIQRTASNGKPIGLNAYEQTRPPELPSIGTIRITRGITWNQCIEAAGFTPRPQSGGKKRSRPAAPAQRPPQAAEYIARPHVVSGPGPAPTVNVYSEAADADPADQAAEQPRQGRPGRALDPAPVSYAGLPEPERDPITDRLPPVMDCQGRPFPRVIVYPHERTCLTCGETFTTRRQRVKLGRRGAERWIEKETGFCPRCGIDEQGNDRKLPTPAASVATLDYLEPGEYQKA